ncbi:MAG: DEAD/DEAH box helicase [Candidatus Nitrosocaldus sp.]
MDSDRSRITDRYYRHTTTNRCSSSSNNKSSTYRKLESRILEAFNRLGYSRLTPIQRKSIPILARKRDSLIVAPTGSGKTEAAMIPILTMVAEANHHNNYYYDDNNNNAKVKGVKVLYITPLRALNRDMLRRLVHYAGMLGLSVAVRHGDTSSYRRRKIQDDPPDVLITTPETLAIILVGKMARAIHALEWIVIDELHELLANKRGAHLALSLERVERLSSRRVVRVGLSATLGNLDTAAKFISYVRGGDVCACYDDDGSSNSKEIRRRRGRRGSKCAIIVDDSLRKYDVDVVYIDAPITDVAEHIIGYIRSAKSSNRGSILLFTNTRDEAEYMASIMREGIDDATISVDVHHGSLSREVREETESRLRGRDGYKSSDKGKGKGKGDGDDHYHHHGDTEQTNVVVCTSSLELGIDVGSISTVIHYGSPRQVSKMAQRIGRSRHRSTESAKGVIFTNSADDEIEALAILKRLAKGDVEEQRIHESPLDVLAHHLVGLALERYNIDGNDGSNNNNNDNCNSRDGNKDGKKKKEDVEVSVEEALALVRRAYQFRNININDMMDCLELLSKNGIVRFDRDRLRFRAARVRAYYYDNASMIPDVLKFDVVDTASNRVIGSLDQEFVGDYGEQGNVFILKGMQWRILAVDYARMRVNVEPYYAMSINVPYWSGEMIPVDHRTAQLVGMMRRLIVQGRINNDIMSRALLIDAYRELGNIVPDDKTFVIEYSPNLVIIHACLGTRINNTLASLLSTIISSSLGYIVNVRSDAYRIMLSSTARIGKKHIIDCLVDDYDAEEIIRVSLKDTHNLSWSVWNVAKRFGLVDANAMYDKKIARMIYERYANTPIVREALREVLHEKYDVDGAKSIIKRLRDGRFKMVWRDVREEGNGSSSSSNLFSPLAEPMMERSRIRVGAYSSPLSNEQAVMEMVRNRLMKSKHRLVCLKCASNRIVEVGNAPEQIACLKCNSRIVAAIHPYDDDTYNAILLKVRNARLDGEQEHRFRRAWKSASLVHTFGRRALLVLSGYGIGVDTAARMLKNYAYEQDEMLVKYIYEAERQYITTRGFWDD